MYYGHHISTSGYDWTYLIIIMILFVISLIVQSSVNKQYEKYGKIRAASGLTGADAAQKTLDAAGVRSTRITYHQGASVSDFYDPKTDTISLSADAFNSCSVSAIGVACHEAGHAIQQAEGYGPYRLRRMVIPFASVCSKISIPLIIAGLILSIFSSFLKYLALAGILLFAVAVITQLITLPVEFNASKRALVNIESCGILTSEELKGAKKVLTAAALTYVVSTLIALVQLLRFISIMNRR